MYKVLFDGAVFEDLQRTGAGVIIQNEQGLLIAAMNRKGRPLWRALRQNLRFGLLVKLAYRGDEF